MSKKIYIAGKVTGLSRVEASFMFGAVQKELMDQGHEVIVPLDIVPFNSSSWEEAMKICIGALMTVDQAYFLPNYKDSPGAMLEHTLCEQLKIPIYYVSSKTKITANE